MEQILYLFGFFMGLSAGAIIGLIFYNILNKEE
jgi:hypothetical protein